MARILLTGGRAPAALELARLFHAAGHAVFLAESQPASLAQSSHAVQSHFLLPPPRQQPAGFTAALQHILRQQRIDLLVPTCEEVFYIAMGLDQLPPGCRVFVEPITRLKPLHHKAAFIQLAQSFGLPVPGTRLIHSPADLKIAFQRWPRLVLKPVYSRFASSTLILPTPAHAAAIFSPPRGIPWIAQQFIAGQEICTYSLAHQGHLTAHAAYRSDFSAGQGAAVLFRSLNHPGVQAWVSAFVEAYRYTGQIAFDFIETPSGQLFAIECNPRATSGVHLFNHQPQFTAAFFDPALAPVFPAAQSRPSMLSAAMLLYALPDSMRRKRFRRWLQAYLSARDVIFRWNDPLPALLQLRSLLNFILLAKRLGITTLQASTADIEWNGE